MSGMARRVFLHIGAMKTGTTSLQARLDLNREALGHAGVLWPTRARQNPAFGDLLSLTRAMPGRSGAWRRMNKQLRAWDGDAVLSFELLAARSPREIRRIVRRLGDAELHVILTARDVARAIPSQWQEHTQNGGTIPWLEYVDGICSGHDDLPKAAQRFWGHQDAALILRKWADFVPLERLHLVTLPASGGDPSLLWARFASVVGVEPDAFPPPESPRNASLGTVSAELMRRVSTELEGVDWPTYRLGFKSGLAKQTLVEHTSREPRLVLPPRHHDWARERSLLMVKEIAQISPRVVGDLADLVPPTEPPREYTDPGSSTDADLLEVAIFGLVGLGTRLAKARLELAQLRGDRPAAD